MYQHMTSRLLLIATAAATLATACAEDPNVPPLGVPGAYHATAFSLATGGGPAYDLLASGASLTMTLAPDHTTTGRLFVPAQYAAGAAVDESLVGTWRQSNDTVYFDGPADTFVRDVPFIVRPNSLWAEYDPPGGQLRVTIMKYGLD